MEEDPCPSEWSDVNDKYNENSPEFQEQKDTWGFEKWVYRQEINSDGTGTWSRIAHFKTTPPENNGIFKTKEKPSTRIIENIGYNPYL